VPRRTLPRLTTSPNAVVELIHPKAMPVILTTDEERDVWMPAAWIDVFGVGIKNALFARNSPARADGLSRIARWPVGGPDLIQSASPCPVSGKGAIVPNTPSRRIRAWNSPAPTCSSTSAKKTKPRQK
jgi:hypothetical protein